MRWGRGAPPGPRHDPGFRFRSWAAVVGGRTARLEVTSDSTTLLTVPDRRPVCRQVERMAPSAPDRARFSVTRRQFVRPTGLGLAGGSLATMLAARQAPAQIKGRNPRLLTWSHFTPAHDHTPA